MPRYRAGAFGAINRPARPRRRQEREGTATATGERVFTSSRGRYGDPLRVLRVFAVNANHAGRYAFGAINRPALTAKAPRTRRKPQRPPASGSLLLPEF